MFGKLCSWGTYLARCDALKRVIDSKSKNKTTLSLWFQYWLPYYANLYTAIEGWRELKLNNHQIDVLIKSNPERISKLRRLRNAVFHYQTSMLDDRLRDFFGAERAVEWAYLLNEQFNQFYHDTFYTDIQGTIQEKRRARKTVKDFIGWYPNTIDDTIENHKNMFRRFKKLARKKDDMSEKAKDVALSAAQIIRVARRAKRIINKSIDDFNA